jgi:acylglycerol lipase
VSRCSREWRPAWSSSLGCATTNAVGTPRILPPPPADVVHTEGAFQGVGGVRLFEQSWRPASGETRGALVLMHGLKDHSSRYADLAIDMAHRGIAVYAFDLRGHGRSEGDRVWVEAFDDYLVDLGTFVDSVRKREPGKPLFLFGHSMGGAIVTLYTLTREPYIQGLILSGPALHVDLSGALISSTKVLSGLAPHAGVLDLDPKNFSRDPVVVDDQKTDPLVFQGPGPARTAAELFTAMDRIQVLEHEMFVPVLLMHGSADKLTDPEGTRALHAVAISKDKTLKIYEGLYHDILHEPERAQVTADFVEWLDARAHF